MNWGDLANIGINAYGAYSGAKATKDASKSQDRMIDRQIALAEGQYTDRAPYRAMSLEQLRDPSLYSDVTPDYTERDTYQPLESKYQSQLDEALGKAASGPDRLALAKAALDDWQANDSTVLSDQYRTLGQKAGALGRIGSGMVTDDLSKALADATLRRRTMSNDLIREATKASVDDRYRALDAYRTATGDDLGLKQQNFGNRRTLGLDALNKATDARSAQGDRFARATSLAGLGYSGDPSAAYQNAAAMYGGRVNANAAATGDAMAGLGYALNNRYRQIPPAARAG